jgi:polar amino acid transport system permease protein
MLQLLAFGDGGWGDELLAGFFVTVGLALATLPVGLALGFLVAGAALSKHRGLWALGLGYTTAVRGIPEILTLFGIYNGVGLLLNALAKRLNPEAGFVELSPFIAGVAALAIVFGAFSGEVLRGAFEAVPKGQLEAARAVGMSRFLAFRRVSLPQVLRFALPGLRNLWVNLVKDTALVSVIGLSDLMRMANVAVGVTKKPFTFFLAACLVYWLVCALSERGGAKLEARASRGVRRAT